MIINYAREVFGQEPGGHISPAGAYHKPSDSFLVIDVAPA
ncbi:phytochelatin synthase family protein, partial [Endozoicomonas sp. ALC013]